MYIFISFILYINTFYIKIRLNIYVHVCVFIYIIHIHSTHTYYVNKNFYHLTALLITKTYSLQEKKMYPAREHKALSVFFIMIFFGSFHLDDGAFILAVASIYDEKYVRKYLVVVLGHLSNVKHFRISPI